MQKDNKDNVVQNQSYDFELKIIDLYQQLISDKNMCYQCKFYEVVLR
jgi:hypothetical protein